MKWFAGANTMTSEIVENVENWQWLRLAVA